jgi:hypothetical protein
MIANLPVDIQVAVVDCLDVRSVCLGLSLVCKAMLLSTQDRRKSERLSAFAFSHPSQLPRTVVRSSVATRTKKRLKYAHAWAVSLGQYCYVSFLYGNSMLEASSRVVDAIRQLGAAWARVNAWPRCRAKLRPADVFASVWDEIHGRDQMRFFRRQCAILYRFLAHARNTVGSVRSSAVALKRVGARDISREIGAYEDSLAWMMECYQKQPHVVLPVSLDSFSYSSVALGVEPAFDPKDYPHGFECTIPSSSGNNIVGGKRRRGQPRA